MAILQLLFFMTGFIFFLELMHQLGIFTVLLQQLPVTAPLNNLPFFQHKDHIGISNGTEAMGHSNHSPGGEDVLNGPLDILFGERINGTGGLIENDELVVPADSPGKRDQLRLPFGKVISIILNDIIIGTGKIINEVPATSFLH